VVTVVVVGNVYATVRAAIEHEVAIHWLGAADVSIHPIGAHWASLPESLAGPIADMASVQHVSVRLKRKIHSFGPLQRDASPAALPVDAIGIDPKTAGAFVSFDRLTGRTLEPGESGKAVVERALADAMGVGLGEAFTLIDRESGGRRDLEIVGLFDGHRIGEIQSPYVYLALADLQSVVKEPAAVSSIDIVLKPEARGALDEAEARLKRVIDKARLGPRCRIVTAKFREMLLGEARRVTDLSLMLVAFVAMLTSFFIILTTMTISLFERTTSLGVMRCIGATRRQMAAMLLAELLPLGVMGTALGVVAGVGLTRFLGGLLREFGGDLIIFPHGIVLACAGGVGTTLLTTLLLIVKIMRVVPLAAIRPHARPPKTSPLYVSGVIGIGLIFIHEWMMTLPDQTRWLTMSFAGAATTSLYLGYILLTPTLVVLCGPPISRLVAPLLGIRSRLAGDQFSKSPWRNTGVCWMLVVGLSLIVYLSIAGETLLKIWNFADRLPQGFIWTNEYVASDQVEAVLNHPAIIEPTYAVDVDCKIRIPHADQPRRSDSLLKSFLAALTRPVFVGCDARRLASMVQIDFEEGNYDDAMAKLDRGGYVLLPVQTAANHGLHLGDSVLVAINDREEAFEVAGVVQAPILDLTVTAMQASSYLQFAAANVLIGTRKDLKDRFDLDVVSMAMFDLEFPPTRPPEAFYSESAVAPALAAENLDQWITKLPYHQEEYARVRAELNGAGADGPPDAHSYYYTVPFFKRAILAMRRAGWQWTQKTPEERWYVFRERFLLSTLAERIGRPDARTGSLRRLKQLGDQTIRKATAALTWLPSIILVVAAIGIGNLMMVSVQIRARQIAMLRAIGAIKSQIIRLILVEAASLGIVGGLCGVALGVHLAVTDNRVTASLMGVDAAIAIPYARLVLGILLTLGICLTAGLLPARRAARNDVVTALQAF